MKTKKPLLLLPLVAAALIGWRLLRRPEFQYAGTVEATEVDLSARVAAAVSMVAVREGDAVTKGQTLAELACEDVRLAADLARRDYERAARLLKEGSLSQETYDRALNRNQDAALKLDWCSIKSPLDGRVLYRLREPGEWVSPGTKLLTVANLSDVYAYVHVAQPMLARLRLGQEVSAFLPELEMRRVPGRIIHIRDEAEFTPKSVQTREERTRLVYGVKVALDNREGLLKPGMPIEVRLER